MASQLPNNCGCSPFAADRLNTAAWSVLSAHSGQTTPPPCSLNQLQIQENRVQCPHLVLALGNLGYVIWQLSAPVHVQEEMLCGGNRRRTVELRSVTVFSFADKVVKDLPQIWFVLHTQYQDASIGRSKVAGDCKV